MIICNGEILAQGSQFSLNDVEVVTATVDLDEVRSARFAPSLRMQAAQQPQYPSVPLDIWLAHRAEADLMLRPSPIIAPRVASAEEEISLGPACWLWDYLRRSKQAGFFLPLSGGIDSCATAVIAYSMARQVVKAIKEGNQQVISDCHRICAVGRKQWVLVRFLHFHVSSFGRFPCHFAAILSLEDKLLTEGLQQSATPQDIMNKIFHSKTLPAS